MPQLVFTDEMVATAAVALALKDYGPAAWVDPRNLPTYLTDEQGLLVYANDACEAFAGRAPAPGVDLWCVTWKLYTDAGEFLPHDQCPMAVAIRERRAVRGLSAVAERPDGTRVRFRPFPTPIFASDGRLAGAVNVLAPL